MRVAVLIAHLLWAMPAAAEAPPWLRQAQTALEHGQFADARSIANRALAATPRSGDAEVILGLADTGEEDLTAAARHFARAVSAQPGNYRAHAYLGSTYLRQNRLAEARQSFDEVLKLNHGNAVAHYNIGLILTLERKPAAALPHFAAVVRSNPSDTAALIGLLECQLDLRQTSAANTSAQKLDILLSADSPALLKMGAALAAHGNYPVAVSMLRRFATSHPQSVDAAYNLALALRGTAKLDEAAGELETALRRLPKPELYNLLGVVEEEREHSTNALLAFEQAYQLEPTNEEFCIDYGRALVNAGDLTKASLVFQDAVSRWSDSLRPRLGLASVYYLSAKYEPCAEILLEALRKPSNAAPIYDLLGRTFEAVPALQPAIKAAFETYLASGARDPAAHVHLAAMLFLMADSQTADRFAPAKAQLGRALALNPRLPQAYLQLGIISQAEGDLQQALTYYQRAAALAPTSAATRYRLGSLYRQLGNRARAQVELDLFRRLKSTEAQREPALMMGAASAVRQ